MKNPLKKSVKVQVPGGEPTGRIICPRCGNSTDFLEVAEGVQLSTHYVQNIDGSFTPVEHTSEVDGEIRLYCGQCSADMTAFHQHFLDMLF